MNINCGPKECYGNGFEISLCGNASIVQGQSEGKYCWAMNETYFYNPVNEFILGPVINGNCK